MAKTTPSFCELSAYDWTGWCDWIPFAALDLNTVPAKPGAYVLSANRPIRRAVDIDPLGILDIGETGKGRATLRARLAKMHRCMMVRGNTGHMAGWRFAFFRFERHFPHAKLRVRWIATETKAEARGHEGKKLLNYVLCHCELPPLNYQFNWDAFEKIGWSMFDDPDFFGAIK